MPYNRLIFVLPSYGLDDFPEHLDPELAADLLGAWTALWHPRLLQITSALPEWKRSDSGSLDVEQALVVAPQAAQSKVDQPIRERFALNQSLWIESAGSRFGTLEAISRALEGAELAGFQRLDDRPVRLRDFYALGFAFLQIHLLTRRLRYSSNLNQPLFTEQLMEAAKASLAGDDAEADRWIQSCFDQLSQERDHYYSQTAYLIDVVLLAPNTLGPKFKSQLEVERPIHFLASGGLIERMAESQPESFEMMKDRIAGQKGRLIGGLDAEVDLSLLSPQDLRRTLAAGKQKYVKLGLAPPTVYSQYKRGMVPELPMHLVQLSYEGAILFDWESASYPVGNQGKISWEGADGYGIDTIANYVLDASSPSSFLAIGSTLGSQLDHHQVPTLTLAHWPGGSCEAFEDFLMAIKRTPALGVWTLIDEYFSTTQRPYHQERLAPSKFPISDEQASVEQRSFVHGSLQKESAVTIDQLAHQLIGWLRKKDSSSALAAGVKLERNDLHEVSVDRFLADVPTEDLFGSDRQKIEQRRREALSLLRDALPRDLKSPASTNPCWLIANPHGGPRRVFLTLPSTFATDPDRRIYAAETLDGASDLVVDVPPMGIVRLEPTTETKKGAKRKGGTIAIGNNVLSNEFVEAHLDLKSGKLQSLYIAQRRGNRMSGMLVFQSGRKPSQELDCTMQAQKIDVRQANSVRGQIQVTGVMIQGSKPIADFQLMFSLWRGSRMVELEIDVTKIDPAWSSREGYVAWRSAWPNESAVVSSWNQGVKQSFHSRKTASPLLIEIDEVEHRGYILAGGNAIHHRLGERFLDTVLGTMPASSVAGNLAFAIDLPRPYQAATEWLDPALVMEDLPQPLSCGQAAWFIQSNAANVSLVPWNAIVDANGQVLGMRAWLHESAGRSTASRIEFFRTPKAASRVSESGKSFSQVEIDGDSLVLSVKANEQSFIDILWS